MRPWAEEDHDDDYDDHMDDDNGGGDDKEGEDEFEGESGADEDEDVGPTLLVLTVADKILMFYHAGVVQTIASMLKWVANAQV